MEPLPHGVYPKLLGPENCWDERRDARLYPGPDPIVAHPPCGKWTNMCALNYARALKEPNRRKVLPAWYPGGDDGGCFSAALWSALCYGGVVEHPAYSHAWEHYGLAPPNLQRWTKETLVDYAGDCRTYWSCEIFQSAYGHRAQKRTWLFYCGAVKPFEMDWRQEKGSCQIGWFDRKLPSLSKREGSATPHLFAQALISLAALSGGSG